MIPSYIFVNAMQALVTQCRNILLCLLPCVQCSIHAGMKLLFKISLLACLPNLLGCSTLCSDIGAFAASSKFRYHASPRVPYATYGTPRKTNMQVQDSTQLCINLLVSVLFGAYVAAAACRYVTISGATEQLLAVLSSLAACP